MAKPKKKKRQASRGIDSVAWVFWLVCFTLLYVPCWLFAKSLSYEDRSVGLFPMIVGFSLAAFGAGLFSVMVNYILQKRAEFARKRDRKKK